MDNVVAITKSLWWRMVAEVVLAVVLGLILSILPAELFLLSAVVLLIVVTLTVYRHKGRRGLTFIVTLFAVFMICYFLPVKPLDRKVGPMAYHRMPLSDLCERLNADHGIVCRIYEPTAKTDMIAFTTDRPMSRRAVLEKLARETNRPLRIAYCGTGATLLFGAWPSFTTLGEKTVSIKK